MTNAEFTNLVGYLRTQAAIWFKNDALMGLEELIEEALKGRRRIDGEGKKE